ncbi:hypothetical protein BH747_10815 [Enterococcus villorum]|uniref:Uncharacterized protein n=2 Tax=Enterococcus villorum TaxID=112904 RepID=A0A1V8Y8E5_9ENTE|nr:hypothetical protein [Enterococcus villorum]OQO68879.1 hypothetical protein BH747_10815 [Enterococcus villorum]OQO75973.1 hypothetical protein BH744_05245 [Enterococcus villorum]
MPYTNEFQRYLDIFSLSLSLKENSHWDVNDDKQNYSILFSLYIKMIQQDRQEFFARSTDKQKILYSLERSMNFYTFTNDEQLLQTLEQMNTNDPTNFILLPIHYSDEEKEEFHTFGMLIYKEEKSYKIILVDKQSPDSQIVFVKIPSEKLPSLCSALLFNRDDTYFEKSYNIISEIFTHVSPKIVFRVDYQLHFQKEGNCVVKEIETTLKTALFHCRHDLFASQSLGKIKWNTKPDSVITMRKYFLDAIKQKFEGPQKPFDLLFKLYLQRKKRNKLSYLTPFETKKKIHQEIKNEMNKYPEIQKILSGKNIYEEGIVIKRIDFFSKLSAENQCNLPHNNAKEKVMLFEKIAKAKEKTEVISQENSKNKNAKSQVPLSIDQ